ncbi:transglycosylase [Mucilaginibacter gracilis]|uniref:Transglycosylase n=1 Tax=Mucilaginibacter gracilis TaxID=423350 RepID=A0A495IWQ0_9SPHI|nr:biosynthetic peptidoglycan transglycosylase [Mucilaginibacter gracilis]RKR81166.1 transglycosylase [Mucilaginibacter gracilis]
MRRLNPKFIRIAGIVLFCLFILVLIAGIIAFNKREKLLQSVISKATAKAKSEYNLDVKIGSARFVGLATVALSQITVVPQNRDSLLKITDFEVGVKIWPLLVGNIKLASVKLDNGILNLSNVNGVKNFDFLFKKKKDTTATSSGDISIVANNLINQVLYKIPDELDLKNFNVRFHSDSINVNVQAKSALIKNGNLTSTIIINNGESTLHFTGKMRPSDKYIDVKLYADNKKVEVPFVAKRYGLKLSFDTISTQLKRVERSDGETRIYGSWAVNNLVINHPKIASNNIIVPNGSIDANIFIGQNYVSIDSSSAIHIKDVTANPYIKYTLKPVKVYELKLRTDYLDAQKLFNSFPQGTFDALDGIQVAGKLSYNLNFYLDTSKPDDVQFDSSLKQDHFSVVKYGRTDLGKLNGPFVYTPYEKGQAMPPRDISPNNPNYTPLSQISPYLQHAVMTAEDPTFFKHNGFVEEALRKSIAVDFKMKKFKRGGSTISMQLVKNAFLSRQKTMVRKIEETLIVWMIENTHIISKQRMLEVYFNIIEWARNVYGIGEASRYYFGKTPAELNLGESIYLASIVPKPKSGLYYFEPDGELRSSLQGYFNSLGNMMSIAGYTQRDSSGYGFFDVRLKAALRQRVTTDTAAIAKMLNQDEDDNDAVPIPTVVQPEKKPNFFQRLFGKKDTTHKKESPADTVTKTKKELRQERREQKRKEKEARKKLEEKGLF